MGGSGRAVAAFGVLVLVGATATTSVLGGCPVRDWTAGAVYWAPVVAVQGQLYRPLDRGHATEDEVGALVGEVRCTIAGRIDHPGYRFRDGDATYLPVGTPVHDRTGTSDQLLVREDGHWQVYVLDVVS